MFIRTRISIAVLSCALIALSSMSADAGTSAVTRDVIIHEVPNSARDMIIDGSLNEAAWDAALVLELAYEYAPLEKAPAVVKTQVLLTSDGGNLYVGFLCFDPEPAAIRTYLTDSDRLGAQLIATSTKYPEEIARAFDQETGDISDRGFELDYSHVDRSWEWRINYLDLGSGFRSDLGFVPRVDIRDAAATLTYKLYGSRNTWWRRLSFSGFYSLAENQSGQFLNRSSYLRMTYLGKLQSNLDVRGYSRREAYGGEEFDLNYLWVRFDFRPAPRAHVYLFTQFGDAIDYTNARSGSRIRLNQYFSYQLGKHLYFNA